MNAFEQQMHEWLERVRASQMTVSEGWPDAFCVFLDTLIDNPGESATNVAACLRFLEMFNLSCQSGEASARIRELQAAGI